MTPEERENARRHIEAAQARQRELIKEVNAKEGQQLYRQYSREQIGGKTKPENPLKNISETPLTNSIDSDIINMSKIKSAYGEDAAKVIEQKVKNAPESVQKVWNKYADKIGFETTTGHRKGDHYDPSTGKIAIKLEDDLKDISVKGVYVDATHNPYDTTFHEIGHLIDNQSNIDINGNRYWSTSQTFEQGKFNQTIKREADEHIQNTLKDLQQQAIEKGIDPKTVKGIDAHKKLSEELNQIETRYSDVSDIFDGATNGRVHGQTGHSQDKQYWNKHNGVAKEAFAEMYGATMNNPKSLEYIQHYFPESYNVFLEILNKITGG